MIEHFKMFAAYNAWANGRLYAAAALLDDAALRQSTGAFFGSMQATLNHILVADRIWLHRMTGTGTLPAGLDVILFEDLGDLSAARRAEDARLAGFVESLTQADLDATFTYAPIGHPVPVPQRLGPALSHVFNHQTHHRGQCHTILTGLGGPSLTLDLIYFLRGEGSVFA